MAFFKTLCYFLVIIASTCYAVEVKILTPSKEGREAALIMVPGAYVSGLAYETLHLTIQERSPFRLWVGLTHSYVGELANPVEVAQGIQIALLQMRALGMNTDIVYLAGHSLGAAVICNYAYDNPSSYTGLVFFGAVPSFPNDSINTYPLPYVIINGDIDGLSRISELAEAYNKIQNSSDTNVKLKRAFTLLEGVNHGSSFASGPMPPNVVENDIDAEISEEEGHASMADITNNFLVVCDGGDGDLLDDAIEQLVAIVDESTPKLQPLIDAKDMEERGNLCPWALQAQDFIIGTPDELQPILSLTNYIDNNETTFLESKASVQNITAGGVVVNTITRLLEPDGGLQSRQSAKSVDCKMKSQEAVMVYLGEGDYADEYTCKQINMVALEWALNKSSSLARSRYESRGQRMVFADDIITNRGSQWVETEIKYEDTCTGEFQITSVALLSDVNFPAAELAGVHYCKLMSPYRAIEWIYTDCLRNGEQTQYETTDEPSDVSASRGRNIHTASIMSTIIMMLMTLMV